MFGRYRLDTRLGAGGNGEVWRALDTSLDRVVALKMLLPRHRDDADQEERFLREARMAARLHHPHIVRVHNVDTVDERMFIDMELIGGTNVAAALAEHGPMTAERAVDVVESVADALDAAHNLDVTDEERRMVHRDVKPGNILLEPRSGGREHVYLVDFGVARPVTGDSITEAGSLVGTPAYMAPELWEGRRVDHRIDVYALAVTLFEMLTGEQPFQRPSLEGILSAHLTAPRPRPSHLRAGLPKTLDAVVVRGTATDRERRYATAGDLARAARAALDEPTVTVPQAQLVRPRPNPVGPTDGPPPPTPLPPPSTPPPSTEPPHARRPYLASPPHFGGLAATAVLLPLYLLDLVDADWSLLLVLVLLYALGACVTAALSLWRP